MARHTPARSRCMSSVAAFKRPGFAMTSSNMPGSGAKNFRLGKTRAYLPASIGMVGNRVNADHREHLIGSDRFIVLIADFGVPCHFAPALIGPQALLRAG